MIVLIDILAADLNPASPFVVVLFDNIKLSEYDA